MSTSARSGSIVGGANPSPTPFTGARPTSPNHIRLYNTNKMLRKGTSIQYPDDALKEAARHPVRLVPIRLDLEVDGLKIRDSFTWNLNETLITPEQFAHVLIDDIYDHAPGGQSSLITQIAGSIRSQCQSWQNAAHEDEDAVISNDDAVVSPKVPTLDLDKDEDDDEDDDEFAWRTIIKLDLQVGQTHLVDQFEWPMMPTKSHAGSHPSQPTPESFARLLCADLGIGSEFVSIVAHSIREQLCYARLNFEEAPKVHELALPPFRKAEEDEGWEPSVETLSEEEIERRFKEQERTARRLRRSQRVSTNNTIVITRSSYAEDDEDINGKRRSSRNPGRGGVNAMNMNNRFNPYMVGSYASFSALPPQYQQGFYSQFQINNRNPQLQQTRVVPYRNYKPSAEEEEAILKKLEETINLKSLPPPKSPPKKHRGFGASANRFNETGDIAVGEFREKWRCSWCLLSGKFTPTLRKGPMGSKTLCNACGIWYGKHGNLPKERYHEHAEDKGKKAVESEEEEA